MRWPLKPFSLAILCFTACCYGTPKERRQAEPYCSKYRAVVYYANWDIYNRSFSPKDLPVTLLTHVLYAFADINPVTGQVFLSDQTADTATRLDNQTDNQTEARLNGCLGQLYSLKRYRNLKVLLSIGGATYSSNFAGPASSEQCRALFASSAVSLIKSLGLDGLDINWEYPDNEAQATDLVSLLGEIRKQLDQYGNSLGTKYHFELTFAAPAGPSNYQKLNLAAMDQYLDFWNLMAYDYTGNWTTPKITGHQANLFSAGNGSSPFNTKSSVDYYTSHGVSSEKIVLGMPMYGRSFVKTKGLGQSFGGIGDGTWEKGVYDFKTLPLNGSSEVYDEKLGASYSWDAAKQELISYDTVKVGRQKAKWIKDMNLGGAMWWESSADKKGGESLIENAVRVLGGCLQQTANNVEFPDSLYANVRSPPVSQLPFSTASTSLISSPSEIDICTSEMPSGPVSGPASTLKSATSPASTSLMSMSSSSSTIPAGQTLTAGGIKTVTITPLVPGENGVAGCAYVIAQDLGDGASCPLDYCNCGGTIAPLLTTIVSGISKLNCNYQSQPSSNVCPSLEVLTRTTTIGNGETTITVSATGS